MKWHVQIAHLILHGQWFKRWRWGDVHLICLTNQPIGLLIHDLWTLEFSSWLVEDGTFIWPLGLYGNILWGEVPHTRNDRGHAAQAQGQCSTQTAMCPAIHFLYICACMFVIRLSVYQYDFSVYLPVWHLISVCMHVKYCVLSFAHLYQLS